MAHVVSANIEGEENGDIKMGGGAKGRGAGNETIWGKTKRCIVLGRLFAAL